MANQRLCELGDPGIVARKVAGIHRKRDIWPDVCSQAAMDEERLRRVQRREWSLDRAIKRARIAYREIVGHWPDGDFRTTIAPPDPEIARLMRINYIAWQQRSRKK